MRAGMALRAAVLCLAATAAAGIDEVEASLLAAVWKGDSKTVNAVLQREAAARNASRGLALFPVGGVVKGRDGVTEAVAAGSGALVEFAYSTKEGSPLQGIEAQLHTQAGSEVLAVKAVEHGEFRAAAVSVQLPGEEVAAGGLLTMRVDGKAKWMVPVLPDRWRCGTASKKCAKTAAHAEAVACVLRGHAQCVEETTDDAKETGVRVAEYVQRHGAGQLQLQAVKGAEDTYTVEVHQTPRGVVYVTEAFEAVEVVVKDVTPAGQRTRVLQLAVPREHEGVLVADFSKTHDVAMEDDELFRQFSVQAFSAREEEPEPTEATKTDDKVELGRRKEAVGAAREAEAAQGGIFWQNWQVQGCLRYADEWYHGGAPSNVVRPLGGIRVKVSSSLTNTIFFSWGVAVTNNAGCFFLQRRFIGPAGRWARWIRIQVRLQNGLVLVADPFSFNYITSGGFNEIRKERRNFGGNGNNNWNIGARTFRGNDAPGGVWASEADQDLREQCAIYDSLTRAQAVFVANGVGWTQSFNFYYPTFGGVALPWGIYLNGWGTMTVLHEAMHMWHYQHMQGSYFPSILGDLINGWGTHNCQESQGVGLLEGFAEYAAMRMIVDIFERNVWWMRTRTMQWLEDHPTCEAENEQGLPTWWRVIRNDDGCTHALHLLTDENFYRRNFLHPTNAWAPQGGPATLDPACQWYPNVQPTFFDVLRAFQPGPGAAGMLNRDSSVVDLWTRFMNIHSIPMGFMQDRWRWMNPAAATAAGQNPWEICRDACPLPAAWFNGPVSATFDTANCRLNLPAMPSGPFIAGNAYYGTPTNDGCPAGTATGPFPGCRLEPALGSGWVNPQIAPDLQSATAMWFGGGGCPFGVQLVSTPFYKVCRIFTAPAGTSLFIYGAGTPSNSNYVYIHTSELLTCGATGGVLDASGCRLGTPPAPTNAFLWGGWFYYTPDI